MANTKPGFVFAFCEYMEDPKNIYFLKYFWFYSIKKDQFWFLFMLKTSSAVVCQKKTLQGNANCSASNTVTMVTKVTIEGYFAYLQFCEKTLMWIFMYFMCKSDSK